MQETPAPTTPNAHTNLAVEKIQPLATQSQPILQAKTRSASNKQTPLNAQNASPTKNVPASNVNHSASQKGNAASPAKQQRKRVEIFGDSMIGGVNPRLMGAKNIYKVHSYGGGTTEDMNDLLRVGMRRNPDCVIIHSGCNDLTRAPQTDTLAELNKTITYIRTQKADADIAVSLLVERNDSKKHLNTQVKDLNNQLKTFCQQKGVGVIEHPGFDSSCLSTPKKTPRGIQGGLHPNGKGNKYFAKDFRKYVESN